MPAISRFQAATVGTSVWIHNHRSFDDVLVLDVADPEAPKLALQPVTGAEGTPMSRHAPLGCSATGPEPRGGLFISSAGSLVLVLRVADPKGEHWC